MIGLGDETELVVAKFAFADTGSEAAPDPKNFWKRLEKPPEG